jgi:hypothetical protein
MLERLDYLVDEIISLNSKLVLLEDPPGRDKAARRAEPANLQNMGLNLNRTFVLPYTSKEGSEKYHVTAYYTLAYQTLVREELKWTPSSRQFLQKIKI